MEIKTQFSFTGILESVRLNLMTTAVFLPHHIIVELPKGRLRVSGSINGAHFSLAIQHRKDGSRFFSVGASLRKSANIQAGDTVEVTFRILDLERVELPEALEVVLHQDKEVRRVSKSLKAQAVKPLGNYVQAIKTMDIRWKNAIEIVQRSKVGNFVPQQNRKNKNK
jgi:hypothetical protein